MQNMYMYNSLEQISIRNHPYTIDKIYTYIYMCVSNQDKSPTHHIPSPQVIAKIIPIYPSTIIYYSGHLIRQYRIVPTTYQYQYYIQRLQIILYYIQCNQIPQRILLHSYTFPALYKFYCTQRQLLVLWQYLCYLYRINSQYYTILY